ncbi:hypothetical protein BWGOE6_55950 [Bacillus mycoides]|nr:hypothetical protein BWGOE6_55950 [Bacillus mycoides]
MISFINETILNNYVGQIPRNLYLRDYKKEKGSLLA